MIVYLIIVLSFCALYPLIPRKHIKWLFLALVLALSVMAFNVVPMETDDLARYYNILERLRRGGWDTLQSMIENGENDWDSLPMCGYYFYIASRFDNNGMLPAMTIFLAYGSMFLVLWRAAEKFNVGKWYLFLSVFLILSTYWFYDICSGIRNGLVYTLFCAYAYFDLVAKKYRIACWVGYALSLLMHSSAIIPLFIVLLLVFTKRFNSSMVSSAMIAVTVLSGFVIPILGDITGIEYLQIISDKAEREMNRFGLVTDTNYLVNISVFLVAALLAFYGYSTIKKMSNADEKYGDMSVYNRLFQYILFFMAGSIFTPMIFLRMARWIIPAILSVVFMVGMQANTDIKKEMYSNKKQKSVIKSGMLISSNELLINFCFIAYTCVHLWYACTGSSLIWLHFS